MNRRILLNPLLVVSILFGSQALLWFALMPAVPTLPGAAPRYESPVALTKWLVLLVLLLLGIGLGIYLTPFHLKKAMSSGTPLKNRSKFWWRLVYVSLAISLVGELVYVRQILQDPSLLLEALEAQNLTLIGEAVRAQKVVGLSSLNNLFVFPTAVLSMLLFHPALDVGKKSRAGWWLLLIGAFVFVHSIFLAARMFFVYYTLTVFAMYLTLRGEKRLMLRLVTLVVLMLALVVWLGELFRGGWLYAKANDIPLFSTEVQKHVLERLVQGYLAADFNNALVILDCTPSMSFVSTTSFAFLAPSTPQYSDCPSWSSVYGTVNFLALLWYDWGEFSFLLIPLMGWIIGFAYRLGQLAFTLSPLGLLYALIYPGLFSVTRINYFFLSAFVVPFTFWLTTTVLFYAVMNRPLLDRVKKQT